MYTFEQSEQIRFLMLSVGVGFALGIFYDILRTVRLALTKGRVAVFIFDVLYFLIFGLATFLFILALNKGEVRLYMIIGEISGCLIYYFSLGLVAIKITDITVKTFRKFFSMVFKVLFAPVRLILKLFPRIFSKIFKFFKKTQKKSQKNRKKLLQKARICVYNLLGILKGRRASSNGGENRMKQKKNKTKKQPFSIIVAVAMVLVLSYFVYSIISIAVDNKRKSNEYDKLSGQLSDRLEENSELSALINSSNEAEIAEKYARENGYAYPDERIYYDATPGDNNQP